MNRNSLSLAAVALLISGGVAFAQQQFDSLGSPTPAPQAAPPTATGPNIPLPRNAAEAKTAKSPAGPILADPKQPATTTGQNPTNPNSPYADD
jgi:hypothetical protein